MSNNPHYDDSQEIHINPFSGKPDKKYQPLNDETNGDTLEVEVGGVEVETQDVKSEEITKDEPKKRRKSRRKKSETGTDSQST